MRHPILPVVLLLLLAACGGSPTEPDDFEFGRIDVYVRDATGAAVNGVAVRLERPNGQIEDAGGLTGSVGQAGYYFFLRTGGEFRIVITPPAEWELASGQTHPVNVTFQRNQTQTVNFTLRRP